MNEKLIAHKYYFRALRLSSVSTCLPTFSFAGLMECCLGIIISTNCYSRQPSDIRSCRDLESCQHLASSDHWFQSRILSRRVDSDGRGHPGLDTSSIL